MSTWRNTNENLYSTGHESLALAPKAKRASEDDARRERIRAKCEAGVRKRVPMRRVKSS